jgi:hypothetical protein
MKQSKTLHGARVAASLGSKAVCHLWEFWVCDSEVVDRFPLNCSTPIREMRALAVTAQGRTDCSPGPSTSVLDYVICGWARRAPG